MEFSEIEIDDLIASLKAGEGPHLCNILKNQGNPSPEKVGSLAEWGFMQGILSSLWVAGSICAFHFTEEDQYWHTERIDLLERYKKYLYGE